MSQPEPLRGEEEEEDDVGCTYHVGSRQCWRCLITFPDARSAARHARRQHPRDFAAAALRGGGAAFRACAALLRHRRGHAPAGATPPPAPTPPRRPLPPSAPPLKAMPTKGPLLAPAAPQRSRQATPPPEATPPKRPLIGSAAKTTPPPAKATPSRRPLACTECGRAFAREGALHRHYIRHARGEL